MKKITAYMERAAYQYATIEIEVEDGADEADIEGALCDAAADHGDWNTKQADYSVHAIVGREQIS